MSRRIRTIKPEITESQSFARCSLGARLAGVYLVTNADDYGRMRGNAKLLARTLFPYDDDAQDSMPGWLEELVGIDFIRCYQVKGSDYVEIVNWSKHQKVDHKGVSRLPSFDDRDTLANVREDFAKPSETVAKPSETVAPDLDQDHGSGTMDRPSLRSGVVGSAEPTAVGKKKSKPKKTYTAEFEAFWKDYPTDANMSKSEAFDEWQKISIEERDLAVKSLPAFKDYCRKNPDYRPVHACRYLKKKRFEGHAQAGQPQTAAPVTAEMFFAETNSPEWLAWRTYIRATSKGDAPDREFDVKGERKRGYWFKTQWPPADNVVPFAA
jgi:hypothetical protein